MYGLIGPSPIMYVVVDIDGIANDRVDNFNNFET